MSTAADLAVAAGAVSTAHGEMVSARDAVLAKNSDVAAVLTTEQAACDTANAAFNAALVTARDATGWTAANTALETTSAAYYDAKATFETVLAELEPLE